jgi:hypothetical protein
VTTRDRSDPRTSGESDPGLEALRCQYLDALGGLRTKCDNVHRALDDASVAYAKVRDHVQHGGRVSDLTDLIDPKPLRRALSTSLDELERTRHHAQRLLFRILEAEGQRKSAIAQTWGISRQLVSRIIHEPDAQT